VLAVYGGHFDIDIKNEQLQEVNRELNEPDLWSNPEKAQILTKTRSELMQTIESFQVLEKDLQETCELLEWVITDNDEAGLQTISNDLKVLVQRIEKLELMQMFSGKMDANNAFLDIQSGAGGTEAQDWAEMLLRMYLRWGEKHQFQTEILEISPGEVAGIKSATIKFSGSHAYGWLRTESGVHRLVRKSPFDSGNRRHTSFAAVFVTPEIDEKIHIEINPADIRIDTYRASGAGGQHVNRTDSAVRITHIPTGIVVQSQSDRSQHRNRDIAMVQLRSKLYEFEEAKRKAELNALEEAKPEVGWGNQIRSYVLDQSRIKDLRTGVEIANTERVLDGDIDDFLITSLQQGLNQDE
jgi:peptide chain release factor 2